MAKQPSLESELNAMAREAAKDIRDSMHQSFFGRPEGQREPGAPMNPTTQEVTKERDVSKEFNAELDMYAQQEVEEPDTSPDI